jgi:hypothetical protein
MSGTSMATPMMTGAVALMLTADRSLTPAQVKQRLIDGSDETSSLAGARRVERPAQRKQRRPRAGRREPPDRRQSRRSDGSRRPDTGNPRSPHHCPSRRPASCSSRPAAVAAV